MPKKTKQTKKAIKPKAKPVADTVSNPKKASTIQFPGTTW